MSISGVNGNSLGALFHQRRLDFKSLASAIEAGDINTAQSALQSYQNDDASIDAAGGSDDQSGSNPLASKLKTDLSTLASAVQSGNISDAQAALKTVQDDRKSQRSGDSSQSQQGGDPSSLVKDLVSLISSIQSGDTDTTQSSAQAVANDLQSLLRAGGPGEPPPPPPPSGDSDTDDQSASSDAAAQTDQSQQSSSSSLSKDLVSLITALQSGDTDTAQSSSQALADDLQSLFQSSSAGETRHHHHHGAGDPFSADAAQGSGDGSDTSAASANSQARNLSIIFKFTEFSADTPQTTTTSTIL